MRLYIIRHADPDYPNNTITPAGHLEAQALADFMKTERLTRIYVSPLGRAQHTAQYTADVTGLTPVVLPWTAEISAMPVTDSEGNKWAVWNLAGEIIRGGSELPRWDNWHELPELAQSDYRNIFREICENSDAFMADHGYRREGGVYHGSSDNRERIAVFCHGGLGVWWLAHLLEIPLTLAWSGLFMSPSSVSTVVMEHRSPTIAVPRLVGLSATPHLYSAGLPENMRGLPTNID